MVFLVSILPTSVIPAVLIIFIFFYLIDILKGWDCVSCSHDLPRNAPLASKMIFVQSGIH